MKGVNMSILSDNNIKITFAKDYFSNDMIIGINKPAGFSMSSASASEINNLIIDAYEYLVPISGTPTYDLSEMQANVIYYLGQDDRVSTRFTFVDQSL